MEPVFEGLTGAVGAERARVSIRTRGSGFTHSAWRLAVSAREGEGTVALVELPEGGIVYRGDGLLLGRDQGALREIWEAFSIRGEEPAPTDSPQLG